MLRSNLLVAAILLLTCCVTHGQILNSTEGSLAAGASYICLSTAHSANFDNRPVIGYTISASNVFLDDAEKKPFRNAVTIGGLTGGILGVVLSLTVWDGNNNCNPLDPFCGALSEEVYKINIPSIILNGAIGGGLGAGVGALIGLGSRAGREKESKNVSVNLGIASIRNGMKPKPSVTLRLSLSGKP